MLDQQKKVPKDTLRDHGVSSPGGKSARQRAEAPLGSSNSAKSKGGRSLRGSQHSASNFHPSTFGYYIVSCRVEASWRSVGKLVLATHAHSYSTYLDSDQFPQYPSCHYQDVPRCIYLSSKYGVCTARFPRPSDSLVHLPKSCEVCRL